MWYRRYLRVGPLAVAVLLAMAPVESTSARLYKWVDEYGNVTYSERKPPGQQAEEIRVRTAPISSETAREQLDSLKEKANLQQKDRDLVKSVSQDNQNEAEVFKKNCEIARQNRTVLEHSSRVVGKDGQGKSYFLDEDEIRAKLKKSYEQIERYCK
jgi:hypothetical protein